MKTIRVWDPLLRVFHWSLVAAFVIAWLTGEESMGLHEWAGYAAAGLIAVRIVWGFVGPHYARFSQFVRGPGAVGAYVGDVIHGREARYIGHNPAGAAMIFAILVTLLGTAFSGWLMVDPSRQAMLPSMPQIIATVYADDDRDAGSIQRGNAKVIEEIHEVLANFMLLLVALHLGGIALASFRHHENLAKAMVTGDKRAPEPGDIT